MPFNVCGSMDLNTELPSAWRVGADTVLWSTELEELNEILEDDYGSGMMLMIYLPL
jgi:hypothetical protein